jgi:hypothetical protein
MVTAIANTNSLTVADVNHVKQSISTIEKVVTNDITSIGKSAGAFRQQCELLQDAVMRVLPETSTVVEHVLKRFIESVKEENEATKKDMQLILTPRPTELQLPKESISSLIEDSLDCLISPQSPEKASLVAESISPRCLCRKRKTKIINEIKRGPLRLFRETIYSAFHYESCPYYLHTERSMQIGVSSKIFSTLLSRVVEGTFSATIGTSGYSITPALSLRHIFRPSSPAFQLLDRLPTGIGEKAISDISPEDMRAQLQRLFRCREASPFDVDEKGRTLLHVCIRVTGEISELISVRLSFEMKNLATIDISIIFYHT